MRSVPRPAFGGAMLTLLRVRREAQLRRRSELGGASKSGLLCSPSFFQVIRNFKNDAVKGFAVVGGASNPQTTNLGVRSSNLFGRAS